MGKNNEDIYQLNERQRELKKAQKNIKRRIPGVILSFIVVAIVLYNLFEGKLNSIFINSTNLMLSCAALFGFSSLLYLGIKYYKLIKITKERKKISNKIYSATRLKD
ncbi:MAG: hypothetical protein JKZ00_05905 [Flavobacteriaceae bacterium]|nr:hypothetical protein [Flavobacteriaceae bacterium]